MDEMARARILRAERGRLLPVALVVRGRTEGIGDGLRGSGKATSSRGSASGNVTFGGEERSTEDSNMVTNE